MGLYGSTIVTLLILACAYGSWQVLASDPELITDFQLPPGTVLADINGSFFTNSKLKGATPASQNFATVTTLNVNDFPALNGLGVSSAILQYPKGAVNPPHTHPRGTELLLVLEGTLDVGLVDTTNKLFASTLIAGDSFVFPRGLVHFQINCGKDLVTAVAAFSSSNPGLVRLPNTLFTESNISSDILAKSFGVSPDIIDKLKSAIVA